MEFLSVQPAAAERLSRTSIADEPVITTRPQLPCRLFSTSFGQNGEKAEKEQGLGVKALLCQVSLDAHVLQPPLYNEVAAQPFHENSHYPTAYPFATPP